MSEIEPVRPVIVWVTGLMGAGKTTIGRRVAQRLGWPFIDNDTQLVENTGRTAADIGEREGGMALHQLEWAQISRISEQPAPFVAAVPASVADSPETLARLGRTGLLVYLRAGLDTLAQRIAHTEHRPWVDSDVRQVLIPMVKARDPIYLKAADLVVATSEDGPAEIADRVVRWLLDGPSVDVKST